MSDFVCQVSKLDSEKVRLLNRLKLPESDQKCLKDQENEIVELHKKLAQLQQELLDMDEDNVNLRKEITGKNSLHCKKTFLMSAVVIAERRDKPVSEHWGRYFVLVLSKN